MVFMHKKTLDIVNELDYKLDRENYIELDELIALPVKMLNEKGYKTLYCCSGHVFGEYVYSDILDENVSLEDIGTIASYYPNCNMYIKFEKDYKFSNLPKGFKLDYCYVTDTYRCIEYLIKAEEGTSDRLFEIMEHIKHLIEWVYELPKIN